MKFSSNRNRYFCCQTLVEPGGARHLGLSNPNHRLPPARNKARRLIKLDGQRSGAVKDNKSLLRPAGRPALGTLVVAPSRAVR